MRDRRRRRRRAERRRRRAQQRLRRRVPPWACRWRRMTLDERLGGQVYGEHVIGDRAFGSGRLERLRQRLRSMLNLTAAPGIPTRFPVIGAAPVRYVDPAIVIKSPALRATRRTTAL